MPNSTVTTRSRAARRRWAFLATAGLWLTLASGALVLGPTIVEAGAQNGPATTAPANPGTTAKPKKPATEKSGGVSKRLIAGVGVVVVLAIAGGGYLIYRKRQS